MIISTSVITVFLLIMTRMFGLIITAPVFNRREIFMLGKVALVFWTSALLIYVVPAPIHPPDTTLGFVLAFASEFMVGAMIGFVTDLLIVGIEFAGSLMDTQAGLSVASMLDPSSGRSLALISLILKWTATMLFLIIDGHHLVLSALMESYRLLPIGSPINYSQGAYYLANLGTYIFFLGVQLSAPIMLVIFMVDFGMGMLNKVAEQVNVFQLGFQVKPSVGLFVFLMTAPGLLNGIYRILETISEHLLKLFYILSVTGNG
ncbi:flagellar biosynthetic protein FliR [bacterium]|nr:flagellar biosynthetic protein FliR [bacterium]